MAYRKWKESKQQPGTAGPGNILGCCLDYFHFLWPIHPIRPVHRWSTFKQQRRTARWHLWSSKLYICTPLRNLERTWDHFLRLRSICATPGPLFPPISPSQFGHFLPRRCQNRRWKGEIGPNFRIYCRVAESWTTDQNKLDYCTDAIWRPCISRGRKLTNRETFWVDFPVPYLYQRQPENGPGIPTGTWILTNI